MAASEDDIGELLDEVERKFCYSSKTTPTKTFPKTTIPKVHHHGNIKTTESAVLLDSDDIIGDDNYIIGEDEDLDKIVSEIMSDTPTESTSDRRRGKLVGKRNSPSHPLKLKCVQVLLTGTAIPLGHSDRHSQKACDQLRCTSCDFHVLSFDHHAWHSHCDYLFFRNRMPNRKKLAENLVHRKGFRAYACQCSWRSVVVVEELGREGSLRREGEEEREQPQLRGGRGKVSEDSSTRLKWVCGRHSI